MTTFGSVCSGIEAASVAWAPLGWRAAWFAEIGPFPCAVLAHHYPSVPNLGDMTTLPALIAARQVPAPDVLCGGTPCQAFSVAGLRKSLGDARGNLSLTFCEIADAIDAARDEPCVVFWENVPGVLSTKDNAFGCFLAGLAGEDDALVPAGGRWTDAGVVLGPARTVAWRVLDAQYFGLAQRRRRVFVVASARNGFDPVAVLLEFDGVRRDSAPSREAGEGVAPSIAGCPNGGGANGPGRDVDSGSSLQFVPTFARCDATREGSSQDYESTTMLPVTHSLRGEASAVAFTCKDYGGDAGPLAPTLRGMTHADSHANGGGQVAVAYDVHGVPATKGASETDLHVPLRSRTPGQSEASTTTVVRTAMQVRRLTPEECEALQGFPRHHTLIPYRGKPAADGPRYKALGNSWAVPVVRWIGARIAVELYGCSASLRPST